MTVLFSWSLWPQYTMALFWALIVLVNVVKHKQMSTQTYNGPNTFLRCAIFVWLLHMGGFW
jgi:hypothetical protein